MATKEIKLDLVKESDFIIEVSESDVFITGTTFAMPPVDAEAWASKNLTVRAYDLTLTKNLSLPGKSLTIVCRFLRTEQSLTISVSGEPGSTPSTAAGDGPSPGDKGIDATVKGGRGGDSGIVYIIAEKYIGERLSIEANGGRGGTGQAGGNGSNGLQGPDANDKPLSTRYDGQRGFTGGKGHPGGDAGAGAKGGDGGNGGNISIMSSDQNLSDKVVITHEAGIGGPGGQPGQPGKGGSGGKGGWGVKCYRNTDDGPIRDR